MELPDLVAALNAQVGVIVRLGVDARDWDDIPRRFTVAGHLVRIGRFADVNHKIIATRGPQDHLLLLVVPPRASTAAAKSALAMAASGGNAGRPEEILVAAGIASEAGANPPRALPEGGGPPGEPVLAGAPALMAEEAPRDEIGRWCDDGAPVHALT